MLLYYDQFSIYITFDLYALTTVGLVEVVTKTLLYKKARSYLPCVLTTTGLLMPCLFYHCSLSSGPADTVPFTHDDVSSKRQSNHIVCHS